MTGPARILPCLLLDTLLLGVGLLLTASLLPVIERWAVVDWPSPPFAQFAPPLAWFAPVLFVFLYLGRLYDLRRQMTPMRVLTATTIAAMLTGIVLAIASLYFPGLRPTRKAALLLGALAVGFLTLARVSYPRLYRRSDHHRRVLVVGANTHALRAFLRYSRDHGDELQVLGVVDRFKDKAFFDHLDVPFHGHGIDLPQLVTRLGADTVVVLGDQQEYARDVTEAIEAAEGLQEVFVRAQVPLFMAQDVEILFVREVPLLKVFSRPAIVQHHFTRMVLDKTAALAGLVCLAVAYPVIALVIRLNSAGPVVYRQQRLGLHNEPFTIRKFRSMYTDAERASGAVLATKGDPRVTPVGRLMRATRIDELPQLVNVLTGDMSMVGPRPERPEFQHIYLESIPWYGLRSYARPGITGLAQVTGEYDTSAQRKLLYDITYTANMSPLLDLRILLSTVLTVLTKKGH